MVRQQVGSGGMLVNAEEYRKLNEGEQSLYKWQMRDHGSFFMALWDAISRADGHNLAMLERGYPQHVEAYRKYMSWKGWWDGENGVLRRVRGH